MKKIISLIASIAMLASMATSAFAATLANNVPVVDTVIETVDADTYKAMMEADLPEGHYAYYVTVTASGLDLAVKSGTGLSGKGKRTGVVIKAASYQIDFDDNSNMYQVIFAGGITSPNMDTTRVMGGYAATAINDGVPSVNDGDSTGTTATSVNLYEALIETTGPMTGTPYSEFTIQEINNSVLGTALYVDKAHDLKATYTVNGEAATSITFGATEEPPVDPEPPVTPEEPKDIIISDPMNLVTENGDIGTAWDVTINNFDDAVDYVAIFTDVDNNTTRDGGQVIKFEAEVKDGKIAFATILNQSQARTVSLNIEKK